MNSLQALATCIGVSLIISTGLVAAITRPLRAFIARACPGQATQDFWSRFATVMLFLSPLFVAVAFGLPSTSELPSLQFGELIQRIVTSALIGAFLSMFGTGLWVSSMARRMLVN